MIGDTLEEIAAEKAAIIAPGKPSVTAVQHPGVMAVIERTARNRRSPLTIARADRNTPRPCLPGAHQRENAALALETMRRLHALPSPAAAAAALARVQWPGRFERLETPLWYWTALITNMRRACSRPRGKRNSRDGRRRWFLPHPQTSISGK